MGYRINTYGPGQPWPSALLSTLLYDVSDPYALMTCRHVHVQPGDRWCLCAARFLQAHEEGAAPKLRLRATHIRTLDIVPLSILKDYAVDLPQD